MTVRGRRRYPTEDAPVPVFDPGDYGKDSEGSWWCIPPAAGIAGGKLTLHIVVEHEDGTVTVGGSILLPGGHGRAWHGYLTRGEWSAA